MKKILGILTLLVVLCTVMAIVSPQFTRPYNVQNTLRHTSLYGILGIGAALVIITGGIDLSIGSVVALVGCLLPWLIVERGWSVAAALAAVMLVAVAIGLVHGLLITKLRLQSFVVTLCGLLVYRGIARTFTGEETQGFGTQYEGLRKLAGGKLTLSGEGADAIGIPVPFLILLAIAVAVAVFLNRTVWGRYLFALGRNEEAARYSGINTDRMTILAYVLCSTLAGLGGILFMLDVNQAHAATAGSFYELYAIAAAVLGGCSLRGGEGSVLGVLIGTAVMRVLYNSIILLQIPQSLEPVIIGSVLLAGVTADELVRRLAARRR